MRDQMRSEVASLLDTLRQQIRADVMAELKGVPVPDELQKPLSTQVSSSAASASHDLSA